MQKSVIWEPVPGLDLPCADIAFAYGPPDVLTVTMRFSNVVAGRGKDLQLCFSGAIALRWESESFGLIPIPGPLPKCRDEKWSEWSFPLLRVERSSWLAEHDARHPVAAEARVHFALISMNDLLHVLAFSDVDAQWVETDS